MSHHNGHGRGRLRSPAVSPAVSPAALGGMRSTRRPLLRDGRKRRISQATATAVDRGGLRGSPRSESPQEYACQMEASDRDHGPASEKTQLRPLTNSTLAMVLANNATLPLPGQTRPRAIEGSRAARLPTWHSDRAGDGARTIALVDRARSALAAILQAPAPAHAGKQGCRGDPAVRLTVEAVEVRTFGELGVSRLRR